MSERADGAGGNDLVHMGQYSKDTFKIRNEPDLKSMKDIQDLSLSASNIQVDPKSSAPDLIAATMILNQGFDSNENRSSQYKIQPPREPFSLR